MPHKFNAARRHKFDKAQYRVINWAEYNESLRQRDDLTTRTEMEPLGELTISTHGRGDLVSGSVKVAAYGTIGGVLRFDLPGIGVAGVQVSQTMRDAISPVRRREGGINTGMALHNREEEAAVVSCRLMKEGVALEEVEIPLEANGQDARFIGDVFTGTDTSDFIGSVRCTAEGVAQFTGMALELDAGNRIFTTLPVVEVNRGRAGEVALDFAHFANGASIVSEMVFMNLETQPSGPPLSPFHQAIPPTRPVIYFYDQEGNPIDPALLVDLTGDLEITEDGPAGAFEQDVAFSSTVFRRRNILRANACSNAAAPRARSVGRRFMPPRTASSIL